MIAIKQTALARPVELIQLEGPREGRAKLALVKGYLSLSSSEAKDNAAWVRAIRRAGWRGAIYQLRWESGRAREILRNIGLSLLLRMGLKFAARRVFLPLPPFGIFELNEIRRHWRAARDRASTADTAAMSELLNHESEAGHWTLVGHSLGARVVFNMLKRSELETNSVDNAVLLGGTMSCSDADWAAAARGVRGSIVNVYHPGDRILNWLYRATEFNRISPCGVGPVLCEHLRIVNVDASERLPPSFRSHMQYHETLDTTVGPRLWTLPAPRLLPLFEDKPAVDTTPIDLETNTGNAAPPMNLEPNTGNA